MAKFNITQDLQGVLIDDVKAGSKAEKVGFLAGDVIIQIEDIEVVNLKTLNKALKRYKNKEKRVYINRYGKILITVLQ
jgi:serine protease Do